MSEEPTSPAPDDAAERGAAIGRLVRARAVEAPAPEVDERVRRRVDAVLGAIDRARAARVGRS